MKHVLITPRGCYPFRRNVLSVRINRHAPEHEAYLRAMPERTRGSGDGR
jgi:hypothetical protein